MPYAGGVGTVEIEIDPYDETTTVTVTVTGPDGTILTPNPTSTDGGRTWTAYFTPTIAGRWVASWSVAGTGEGYEPQDVWVSRDPTPAEAAAWRPLLEDVAAYVPSATLVGAVDGYGTVLYTFGDGALGAATNTHPRASSVQRLITDACSWVLAATGDLDATLADSAKGLASRRAAGWVQYTFVDDADDRAHAEKLLAATDAELKTLVGRNAALTGDDPSTSADEVLPEFWFPTVDSWCC